MDTILLTVAILCGISLTSTVRHWIVRVRPDERDFEVCITDIRAMNTYNSYFLAGIISAIIVRFELL